MKKFLVTIFSFIFFCSFALANNVITKVSEIKSEKLILFIDNCHTSSSFNITCANGSTINLGVFSIEYNCQTGEVISTTWQGTGKKCGGTGDEEVEPIP